MTNWQIPRSKKWKREGAYRQRVRLNFSQSLQRRLDLLQFRRERLDLDVEDQDKMSNQIQASILEEIEPSLTDSEDISVP